MSDERPERRVPVLPTLLVALAVLVMIGLGIWQWNRVAPKEELIARHSTAESMSADVPFPANEQEAEPVLYRHSRVTCASTHSPAAVAGRSEKGEPGIAHAIQCVQPNGRELTVVLGWSRDPMPVQWPGGEVGGFVAPGPRLVAGPPLAGLQASARPDPRDIPNNHLFYAVQWFLFALTALVIYALALRKRWRAD